MLTLFYDFKGKYFEHFVSQFFRKNIIIYMDNKIYDILLIDFLETLKFGKTDSTLVNSWQDILSQLSIMMLLESRLKIWHQQ